MTHEPGRLGAARTGLAAVDRAALADVAPVAVGLVPFAALIGVQVAATPAPVAAGLSGSLLLYAGSAQLSVLTLVGQGAGILSVLLAVALVNARFLAYGPTLAPRFAAQPGWFRLLGAHLVVDQAVGLVMSRTDLDDPSRFRRYWLTVHSVIAAVWVAAMTAGALLAVSVPHTPGVAFVPTAAFVALLVPALDDRPAVAAAVGAAAVTLLVPATPSTAVLAGIGAGIGAGCVAGLRAARAAS